ncbi:hypothetical protein ACWD5Q_06400 [Streptomyces sp. NPDC002513]
MKGRIALGAVVGLVVIGTVSAHADRVDRQKAPRHETGGTPSVSAGAHPESSFGPTAGGTSGLTRGDGGAPGTSRAAATP